MNNIGFIIFGGTGDLAKRKLLPSFCRLLVEGTLGPGSYIVGVGRKELSDEEYKELVSEFIIEELLETDAWKEARICYYRGDFSSPDALNEMPAMLDSLEDATFVGRIHYLATHYQFMPTIVQQLDHNSLLHHPDQFRRVVFEKPFGNDLKSSTALNDEIGNVLDEENIYRIDHYLGKETVRNILAFRFGNPLFESVWNGESIEQITIAVEEELGVGNRLGYYDKTGAIKDMIQSHLLQLVSLVLMDGPEHYTADDIHDKKVGVLNHLKTESIRVGQYEGYAQEVGNTESQTETYVEATLVCQNERWKNTRIVLRTGKQLEERKAYIEVVFRKTYCQYHCKELDLPPNKLVIHIQPTQDICFYFNQRIPQEKRYESVPMSFCRTCHFEGNSVEAYVILLKECLQGKKTLFTRFDELHSAWKVTDTLIKVKSAQPLEKYTKRMP